MPSEIERLLRDPRARQAASRRARRQEATAALGAAAWAIATVWCLLGPSDTVATLPRAQAGGLALLCLVGTMAVAAQAGITRRFLELLDVIARGS